MPVITVQRANIAMTPRMPPPKYQPREAGTTCHAIIVPNTHPMIWGKKPGKGIARNHKTGATSKTTKLPLRSSATPVMKGRMFH